MMKRLKKILKWAAIGLGVLVAIVLAINTWFVWTTGKQLDRQLEAIRAAGDPLTLADLAPKPIPPEKNAATYLLQADAGMAAIEEGVYEIPHFREYFDTKDPMPAEIQKAVKPVFLAHPEVIQLLRQAAECPSCNPPLDYSLPPWDFLSQAFPFTGILRGAQTVLMLRTRLLVAGGDEEEALRTALVALRLARHSERIPGVSGLFLILNSRGMAIDDANMVLQAGNTPTKVREALDAELAIHERMDAYAWAMKSERANGLSWFQNLPLRNFWLFYRGDYNQCESKYLDAMQGFMSLPYDRRPYSQTICDLQAIAPPDTRKSSWVLPCMDLIPPCMLEVVTRTQARIRCLRVLNALQIHMPAGSMKTPTLAELGLPAETCTDPFTGEPLHVKKTPQGWLVYSVGQNCQDDGGKIDDFQNGDVGLGPPIPPKSK